MASPPDGASVIPAGVRDVVDEDLGARLAELRRALHAEPELSMAEHRTQARLETFLRDRGIAEVRRVGTGLVARIPGTRAGAPVVAVRGDIDALPITEATGLPFASRVPGVMHACGHDIHASWAAGAAALLLARPAEGDVLVVLQPGEETGRGALTIIESGALDEARAIFGAHVDMRFAVGQVVADEGPLAASSDAFEITVVGRGAHAARPHESADPIVAAAAVVVALQTIVSRRLNPATPAVITVGTIQAGTAHNVIPDRAVLTGTVRAVDPSSRALLLDELRRVATGVAQAHGTTAEVRIDEGTPPVVNAAAPTAIAREAVAAILGASALVPLGITNMAAEDFAHYQERIPGCFLRVGARGPGQAPMPAHSPAFAPDEGALVVGAAVLAECARGASAQLTREG